MSDRVSLSPKQYAKKHGVSTRTVHRWIKSGRIPVVRYTARTLRIEFVTRKAKDSDSCGQIMTDARAI